MGELCARCRQTPVSSTNLDVSERQGDTESEVRNWRVFHQEHAAREVNKGVNLHVKRDEIVGIAGLMGAGRTELAMSIFGRTYGQGISGQVFLHGKEVDTSSVQKAIES